MNKYLLVSVVSIFSFLHADDSCCDPLFYDSCSPVEVNLTLALDDFRGIYSGSWMNSFGALAAVNLTIPIGCSFSGQLAASYGLYEWSGRASTPFKNSKSLEQQGFATIAATWLTDSACGWNAGVAYDWMFNKNFGLFAVDPSLDQIRGQVGYLFNGGNELGVWATYGIRTAHEHSQQIPLRFRGISQVNLFWVHYFDTCGYLMFWAGTPYRRGLLYTSGRPGTYTFGLQFSVPVSQSFSIEGHGSYMGARGGSGVTPSKNYGANLYLGLTYSFGKRRVMKSPYMTLGNNSNFMVDTNQNF